MTDAGSPPKTLYAPSMQSNLIAPIAAAAAGLLVGIGTGLGTVDRTPEPDPTPPATRPVVLAAALPLACPQRQTALDGERERLDGELQALDLQLRIAEHRRVGREGVESEWPDEPPPNHRPEALERNLTKSLGDLGGELLKMECDEYPCLIAVSVPAPPDQDGVPHNALDGLVADFNALDGLTTDFDGSHHSEPSKVYASTTLIGDHYVAVFALSPDGDEIDQVRTDFRGNRLAGELFAPVDE